MPTRRNVWKLGDGWNETILWYARGVAALKARPLRDRTSWRFLAAMHGIQPEFWNQDGHYQPGEEPSAAVIRRYWQQCQHGTWFFLPWHRGYLLAFEKLVRAAIVKTNGPSDWALPYWDYFQDGESQLPDVFAREDWPGSGRNPLFVPERWGPHGDGNVFVDLDVVNLDGMRPDHFTGTDAGDDPGFGGLETGFAHGGRIHGAVETQPHDYVHGVVGGPPPDHLFQQRGGRGGLMSDPRTAALDPIFWLHHANIDRLWAVWRGDGTDEYRSHGSEMARWPNRAERAHLRDAQSRRQ